MLFNAIDFWLFFAAVATGWFTLPHRLRMPWLLVASAVFYMWWNASYIVLVALSTVVDYGAGRLLAGSLTDRQRTGVLAVSLTSNLGLLFTFKYWGFFHDSLADLATLLGLHYVPPNLHVLLPVGISFYTFQTMSYTIDLYRRRIPAERSFGHFSLFVLFFPQLVAGPIERAGNLLRQLRATPAFDVARVASGLQLALWGLFKKVVIADRLSIYVDATYGNVEVHNGLTLLIATYAFAIQIYCDFSGYSDIAIGVAKVLGIDLMTNFERPYFATSIRDFWRRWHISLSTWLRDYLYISLGGNRGSEWRTYRNLMITMLLGGLWHGASWNFVIWGGLQGLMLSVSRATLDRRDAMALSSGIPRWLRDGMRMITCFHLVCFSWVFFRAATLPDALGILTRIATQWDVPYIEIMPLSHAGIGIIVLLAVEVLQETRGSGREWLNRRSLPFRYAAYWSLAMLIVLLGVQSGGQFIYFQF